MADPFDFTPQAPNVGAIAEEWNQALKDPNTRTALLQAGISLMQPPNFGQTAAGHLGQAIGSAGEAVGRRTAEDRAESEADTRNVLREARAGAAEARAGTANAALGLRQQGLDIARERLQTSKQLTGLQRQISAANAYSRYMASRSPLDETPALSREEFYNKSGFGDLLSAGVDVEGERRLANQAIASGTSDPELVRRRFREKTGQEL